MAEGSFVNVLAMPGWYALFNWHTISVQAAGELFRGALHNMKRPAAFLGAFPLSTSFC